MQFQFFARFLRGKDKYGLHFMEKISKVLQIAINFNYILKLLILWIIFEIACSNTSSKIKLQFICNFKFLKMFASCGTKHAVLPTIILSFLLVPVSFHSPSIIFYLSSSPFDSFTLA